MVIINKNSINTVALTLLEKSEFPQQYTYNLFVFENAETGEEKIFTSVKYTSDNIRYEKFYITESGTTENRLEGIINITGNTAQWNYKIYESLTSFSADTLSISATTGNIIEQGRVLVKGIQNNNNTINNVYL
jgi:hypothetical protein